MSKRFKHVSDFDGYARANGGWFYDNGWRYKDESFGSAYVRDEKAEGGRLVEYLLMLRDGDTPDRTVVLHQTQQELTEVWSGLITTTDDFDKMNAIVAAYIERRSGTTRLP